MNALNSAFEAGYASTVAPEAPQPAGAQRRRSYANNNGNGYGRADEPETEFWVNIGLPANGIVEGEDAPRFISLPMGLPLDTMKPAKVTGNDETYRQLQTMKNRLWEEVMNAAARLQPGQEMDLPLQARIRRIKPKTPVQTAGSPLSFTLAIPAPVAALPTPANTQAAPVMPTAPASIMTSAPQPVYATDAFEDEQDFEFNQG